MASRKSTKKPTSKEQHQPDYYPLVKTIPIGVDGGSLGNTTIADTAKLLSIANRRLYRFGNKYQVKIDLDVGHTVNGDVEFEVYALVNNWDIQRAFALAKDTYEEAMQKERKMLGKTNVARWEDFRVAHGVTGAFVADPMYGDRGSLSAVVQNYGELQNSVVDNAGVQTEFTWGPVTGNNISLIEEWSLSGQTGSDPQSQPGSDSPYSGVNSDDSSAIERANLTERGNLPPYNQNTSSQVWIKVATLYHRVDPSGPVNVGMQRTSTGYFDAPCGLVCLKSVGPANLPNGSLRLTAKSGEYKGVAAHAMCQPRKDA